MYLSFCFTDSPLPVYGLPPLPGDHVRETTDYWSQPIKELTFFPLSTSYSMYTFSFHPLKTVLLSPFNKLENRFKSLRLVEWGLNPGLPARESHKSMLPASTRSQLIGAITRHFSFHKTLASFGSIGGWILLTLTSTLGQHVFLWNGWVEKDWFRDDWQTERGDIRGLANW